MPLSNLVTLFVAVAIISSQGANAQSTSDTGIGQPETVATEPTTAVRFARLYASEGLLREFLESPAYRDTLRRSLEADAGMRDMEAQYPGILDHFLERVSPALVTESLRALPSLHAAIANLISQNLTPDQIESAIAFFESEAGRSLARAQYNNLDLEPAITSSVQGEDLTADSVAAMYRRGVTNSAGALSPEHLAASMQFFSTTAGRRLRALEPELARLEADSTNRMSATGISPEFARIAAEAIQEFVQAGSSDQ